MAELPPGWPAMSIDEAHARLTAPGEPFETAELEIRGVRTKVWKNQPGTLRAVLDEARRYAAREFIVFEDERVTYGAFLRAVAVFARELEAMGVQKGDRVAILMRNLPEWAVAYYGAAATGAVVVPINAWWTGPELQFGLADSGAKAAVVDGERWTRIEGLLDGCPALERVYVCRPGGGLAAPASDLADLLGPTSAWDALPETPLPDVQIGPEDLATIFYTSGTTGRPKGVLSSHRAVNCNAFTLPAAAARTFFRRGERPPPADPAAPQRVVLLAVPLFHVAGCHTGLNLACYSGFRVVMMRKWDVIRGYELIERERVTIAGNVTAISLELVDNPARANYDLSSVQVMSYGGAPCPPDSLRRLNEALPWVEGRQAWGMTEVNGTVTSNYGDDYRVRPDSCGVAAAVAELQIRDPEDGRTVLPVGQVGELWSKGPMNAVGYWNRPEATAETFVDGWVRTGDLARLDEEGFCYIVDRAKDIVIRGGENISCIEVENALYSHPQVIDAAVVAKPHPTLGEEPAAVVTLRPGASVTEEELRAHVAGQLAGFKVPVEIRVWPELLPRNRSGKIIKPELRQLFLDRPA